MIELALLPTNPGDSRYFRASILLRNVARDIVRLTTKTTGHVTRPLLRFEKHILSILFLPNPTFLDLSAYPQWGLITMLCLPTKFFLQAKAIGLQDISTVLGPLFGLDKNLTQRRTKKS